MTSVSSSPSSKAQRRQREIDVGGASAPIQNDLQLLSAAAFLIPCDDEIIKEVKRQMIPLTEHRSDVVDVRENELGLRECHIVAALLGLDNNKEDSSAATSRGNYSDINQCRARRLCYVVSQKHLAAPASAAAASAKKTDAVSVNGESRDVEIIKPEQHEQRQELRPIAHFFERVHTMRLQLGASILPSHHRALEENKKQPNNKHQQRKNLNNLAIEGGFDVVLAAVQQHHSPFLRRLDLSRNRFFTRNSNVSEALSTRKTEIRILCNALVSCQKLTILNLSHNVNMRSDGAVAIFTNVVTKLPALRAVLMQRCSIDDCGAIEVASLFAQGRLPAVASAALVSTSKKNQRQPHQPHQDNDDESEQEPPSIDYTDRNDESVGSFSSSSSSSRFSHSVLLTIDFSHNRIGPAGLTALRKSIPDCVGIGCEKQSPPLNKTRNRKQTKEATKK